MRSKNIKIRDLFDSIFKQIVCCVFSLMKTMDLNLSDDEEFAIETNLLNGIVFDHDDTVHASGVNTNEVSENMHFLQRHKQL